MPRIKQINTVRLYRPESAAGGDAYPRLAPALHGPVNWRVIAVICYGKSGEISTNRREEAEMTALCLRILQASLVYVNTLMLQDVLAEPEWAGLLAPVDRCALTPLFWEHVRPYGEVRLDLGARLTIRGAL